MLRAIFPGEMLYSFSFQMTRPGMEGDSVRLQPGLLPQFARSECAPLRSPFCSSDPIRLCLPYEY